MRLFTASGKTVLVAASSSTSVAATRVSTDPGAAHVFRIAVPTTGAGVPTYLSFGTSDIGASVPSTATPSFGACFLANGVEYVRGSPNIANCYVSAVTSAGTASVYVTPGSLS